MYLEKFSALGFRSFSELELQFDSRLIVFWGDNGIGKTNILEGIGVLSTLRSFRGSSFREAVRWGEQRAALSGSIVDKIGRAKLTVNIEALANGGIKKVLLDDVQVRDLSRYFDRLRAVVFTPDDTNIIKGGPEDRRRFVDRAAFTMSPMHLEDVRLFKRILAQKSVLLKQDKINKTELDIWNQQLAPAGANLTLGRRKLVQAIEAPAQELHERLSSGGRLSFKYQSCLDGKTKEELIYSYLIGLDKVMDDEIRRGMNLFGPQRDEFVISFEPEKNQFKNARSFGSQGQIRTLALCLKLAELKVAGADGDPPLMLIDDLSSELDGVRTSSLISLLEEIDAQVLVTTTSPEVVLKNGQKAGQAINVASLK